MTRASSSAGWLDALRTVVALVVVSLGAAAFAMVFRGALSALYERVFRAQDVLSAFERLPPLARIAIPAAGSTSSFADRVRRRSCSSTFAVSLCSLIASTRTAAVAGSDLA